MRKKRNEKNKNTIAYWQMVTYIKAYQWNEWMVNQGLMSEKIRRKKSLPPP